jgi:uncharacterized protein YciI
VPWSVLSTIFAIPEAGVDTVAIQGAPSRRHVVALVGSSSTSKLGSPNPRGDDGQSLLHAERRGAVAIDAPMPAGRTLRRMPTMVFRLKAPRPTFALDMTEEEREIMGRHAAYWKPLVDSGQMVVFGPVLDTTGSWGLGVVEVDDEDGLRAFAAGDPVVTTGTADIEVGTMLAGFVRSR